MFDQDSSQDEIYSSCVHDLVDACFEGYNATVLAYGQTGSGKTYTMGTAFDTAASSIMPGEEGIIPRAIAYIFDRIEQTQREHMMTNAITTGSDDDNNELSTLSATATCPKFSVLVQFMELYNEEINDLFASLPSTTATTTGFSSSLAYTTCTQEGGFQTTEQFVYNKTTTMRSRIEIHEDHAGGINVQGCSTHEVRSASETLDKLRMGARIRTTGATNMNLTSSRSHAIFTLHLKQTRLVRSAGQQQQSQTDPDEYGDDSNGNNNEYETLSAKFHFVDLAGSERLKRTGATGHRAKEGISINRGLVSYSFFLISRFLTLRICKF